jgi:hypothetical protein
MNKAKIEFTINDEGSALFEANDSIDIGELSVNVYHSSNVPCPINFNFKRKDQQHSFSMTKSEARQMILYLLAMGI